jgi:hypothetical protein
VSYRPRFRQQKPQADPTEPFGREGEERGNSHAWNNCTMTSGAMALDYHTRGKKRLWGGRLRHKQSDLTGGTDLGDLATAWKNVGRGYKLKDRTGQGRDGVKRALAEGRAVVIQGVGDTPGRGTYKGPHAGLILPDKLWGDPLASGWQKDVPLDAILDWAQRLNRGIQFAVTRARQ